MERASSGVRGGRGGTSITSLAGTAGRISIDARIRRITIIFVCSLFLLGAFSAIVAHPRSSSPDTTAEDDAPPSQRARTLVASISSFTVSPNVVYVGDQVTFFANASSTTSSTLKFTLYFDYLLALPSTPNPASGKTVIVTGNPGQISVPYAYDHPGNFTGALGTYFVPRLYVDDGVSNVSRNLQVYVNVRVNVAPTFEYSPPRFIDVNISEPIDLQVLLKDNDNDTLNVTWDFGDGSVVVDTTSGAEIPVYSNQTHAWIPEIDPGVGDFVVNYTLNITVDDGFGHVIRTSSNITVHVPPNESPVLGLRASASVADPADTITLYANATDLEGDPLTWTFDFGDGNGTVRHSDESDPSTTQWMNVTHAYGVAGNFTVVMFVSDALIPNQVFPHNKSESVLIRVKQNTAPSVSTTITADPQSPEINLTLGNVTVLFFVDVSDADADAVTGLWYLDGVQVGTNVSQAALGVHRFYLTLVFDGTGVHNVSINVTDGREGHDSAVYLNLTISSRNLPPDLERLDFSYAQGDYAAPNETIVFTIVLSDPEEDVIELSINFGDNTGWIYFNLTDYVDGNVTLLLNHSYLSVGEYRITIRYTDNKIGILNHTKTIDALVKVEVPEVKVVQKWNWWDYTCLSLLWVFVAVIVVRMVYVGYRRRRLEREGVSVEEAKLRKELTELGYLPPEEPDKGQGGES